MSTALTIARNLFNGTWTGDQPWYGDAPKLSVDFCGNKAPSITRTKTPNGTLFHATLTFGDSHWSHGIHCDSGLLSRLPKDEALLQAFTEKVSDEKAALDEQITRWFNEQTWKIMDTVLGGGHGTRDEWEEPTDVVVHDISLFGAPRANRFQVEQAFQVTVTLRAKPKAPVSDEKPFSEMSDAALNRWIEENVGPENIYMDGECSWTTGLAHQRTRLRRMSPRQQQNLLGR